MKSLKQYRYILRTRFSDTCRFQMFGLTNNLLHNSPRAETTVDSDDVHRHGQLMKEWWNVNGPIKALHSMNLVRVPLIRDGLIQCSPEERQPTPLMNKKILDVGCGGGILSEALASLGANVTGVDAGKDLIGVAIEHSKQNPKLENNLPSYLCTTIEEHCNDRPNYYDAVVASEVIEHVANKELFVQSCVQTMKPGGKIFFTTPNKTRLSQVLGIWFAEYVLQTIPRGTHQYDKFTTPTELTFLLERNNCHVEMTHGLLYSPFSNKWEFIESHILLFALQAMKIE